MSNRKKSSRKLPRKFPRMLPRRVEPFERAPRILIVTEGSKSEVDYFRRLRARLRLPRYSVLIRASKRSDPSHVVSVAMEEIKNTNTDFQTVFCVFDRDTHSRYAEAVRSIEALSSRNDISCKNVVAATSVPCFEYWYFLHISDSRKAYGKDGSPCRVLEAELKKHYPFENYEKSSSESFFDLIWENRSLAIERSKRIFEEPFYDFAYDEDPSTRVHLVVEGMERLAKSLVR